MKKILFTIAILFSMSSFAQITLITQAQVKSDTLSVPIGKYKFIKIGDKVYEIETKLKEVGKYPNWDQAFIDTSSTRLNIILNTDTCRFIPYVGGTTY